LFCSLEISITFAYKSTKPIGNRFYCKLKNDTIVHTLIEETKEFQLKKLLLSFMNMKTKWFFQLFRQEDQVITALIANSNAAIKIFTLDTGRFRKPMMFS
jgi:hypothetical protein